MTSLTLCSLSMRRTFWQGVTSRAECAKLSASSSFERSSFSFKDFANTSTVFVRVYLIYVYNTIYLCMHTYMHAYIYTQICIYIYICMYVRTCFRVLSNAMATQVESDGIVPHHALRPHSVSKLQRNENRRVAEGKRFNVYIQSMGVANHDRFHEYCCEPFDCSHVRIFNGSRVERKAYRGSFVILVDANALKLACAKITARFIVESVASQLSSVLFRR